MDASLNGKVMNLSNPFLGYKWDSKGIRSIYSNLCFLDGMYFLVPLNFFNNNVVKVIYASLSNYYPIEMDFFSLSNPLEPSSTFKGFYKLNIYHLKNHSRNNTSFNMWFFSFSKSFESSSVCRWSKPIRAFEKNRGTFCKDKARAVRLIRLQEKPIIVESCL